MNMIKFAELISYLTVVGGHRLDKDQIAGVENRIVDILDVAPISIERPKVDLCPMFTYMLSERKIDAIREHRAITGMGLKESKDEIERLMNNFKEPVKS